MKASESRKKNLSQSWTLPNWMPRRDRLKPSFDKPNQSLKKLVAGPRRERIKTAEAEVASAASQYENARLRLERRKSLRQSKAILVEEFQQAEYDAKTRKAQLEAAKKRLEELKNGTRSEKINAQEATVSSLRASLEEINVSIDKSTLRAPYSATVSERFLDPGSIATPSLPVIKLVQDDQLEAWIGLPVEIASQVENGEAYKLEINGQEIEANASAKIAEVDQATRTQMVIFDVHPRYAGQVVSGQLCKVSIVSTYPVTGYWVPTSALNKGIRGLWSVMTVVPDASGTLRTRKRDIVIARTDAQRVFVEEPIQEGTRIVANGVHKITQGQAVSDASIKQQSDP